MNKLVVGNVGAGKSEFIKKEIQHSDSNLILISGVEGEYDETLNKTIHAEKVAIRNEKDNRHFIFQNEEPNIIHVTGSIITNNKDADKEVEDIITKYAFADSQIRWDIIFDGYFDEELLEKILRIARTYNCHVTQVLQDINVRDTLLSLIIILIDKLISFRISNRLEAQTICKIGGSLIDTSEESNCITADNLMNLKRGEAFKFTRKNSYPHEISFLLNTGHESLIAPDTQAKITNKKQSTKNKSLFLVGLGVASLFMINVLIEKKARSTTAVVHPDLPLHQNNK